MNSIQEGTNCPADALEGAVLTDGWVVGEKIAPKAIGSETGGHFSVGYLVSHEQHGEAFLKALDLSGVLQQPNPTVALQAATQSYNYECMVLEKCDEENMSRVVKALTKGEHRNEGDIVPIPYLIFERAECDVRKHMDALDQFDTAWALKTLHQIAIGVAQLHGQQIAHQDLKPSNVLMIAPDSGKVGDLGRADYLGHAAPHADFEIAGDPKYAPPELLYRHISSEWQVRRLAPDLYLLGSLVLFFFTRNSTTAALISKLPPAQRVTVGQEPFSQAMPFIREAFDAVVTELENSLDGIYKNQLVDLFRELSDPDPELRGHYAGRFGNRYSLQRYVSKLDRFAKGAEAGLVEMLSS